MNYSPESEIHNRSKVKVVLDLTNYATKNNQNMLKVLIHLIQLLKKFIASKAEFGKLDINKLFNVSTGLNTLKAKLDDLDVGELRSLP